MIESGFLFDLDGVLIDTYELHWKTWKLMKEEISCLQNLTYECFQKGFGTSNDSFLLNLAPKSTKEERRIWGEKKEALFREFVQNNINFFPGIESFLGEIQKAQIPMIIATSSSISNMEFYIYETPIGNYFQTYVSAEEVKRGKPAPDIFLEAASRLHISPNSTIILEDSLSGLQAAKDAGGMVVGISTTHSVEDLKARSACDLIYSPQNLKLDCILDFFKMFSKKKNSKQSLIK